MFSYHIDPMCFRGWHSESTTKIMWMALFHILLLLKCLKLCDWLWRTKIFHSLIKKLFPLLKFKSKILVVDWEIFAALHTNKLEKVACCRVDYANRNPIFFSFSCTEQKKNSHKLFFVASYHTETEDWGRRFDVNSKSLWKFVPLFNYDGFLFLYVRLQGDEMLCWSLAFVSCILKT